MGLLSKIFSNTRKPEGFFGRMMVNGMNGGGHARLAEWGLSFVKIAEDANVLDVGCGGGANIARHLIRCPRGKVTGIDYSPVSVKKSREVNAAAIAAGRCKVVEGSADALPFEDVCFDLVTAIHVLENLDDGKLAKTVQEIRRVLKDDGRLFVRCFTPRDMRAGTSRNGLYYRYFTADELVWLFEGLDVLRSSENDEPTRFGTIRSRAECLFRKPSQEADARN